MPENGETVATPLTARTVIGWLRAQSPDVRELVISLGSEDVAEVKAKRRAKRNLTPEAKAKQAEGLARARATVKANRAARAAGQSPNPPVAAHAAAGE